MFSSFKTMGDGLVALLDPSKSVALVAGFQSIVATWAVIYILYIAYMFYLGKVDNPVRQIIYKMMMFGFISLFAFNSGEWYDFAIGAIKGLSDWLSGGGIDVIFAKLDDGILAINKISKVYFKYDSTTFKLLAVVGTGIIFVSYMLISLLASILLVINTLTLQIIFILAPFAFVSLFFPFVRGIFDRWLEMIISNVFTIFFLSLFTNVVFDKYQKILDDLKPTTTTTGFFGDSTTVDIFLSAFAIVGYSVLGFFLLLMSTQLASKLSSVSIESAPKGAAIATAITAVGAGKGYSAGKGAVHRASKSVVAGAGKITSTVGGVSRKAGSVGSKAHNLLKQQGKKASSERKARRGK